MNGDTDDSPKHRWYQLSLLEMLLITTLVAVVLGILKLAGAKGLWIELFMFYVVAFALLQAVRRFRRKCIDNGIWYPDTPDTGQTGSVSDFTEDETHSPVDSKLCRTIGTSVDR